MSKHCSKVLRWYPSLWRSLVDLIAVFRCSELARAFVGCLVLWFLFGALVAWLVVLS